MSEIEKLRVRIVRRLFYWKYPPSNDPLAYNLRWEDIPFEGCPSSQLFYDKADAILSDPLIKILLEIYDRVGQDFDRICVKEKDQSLPRISEFKLSRSFLDDNTYTFCKSIQQDMLKDGWVRVEPKEEER